MKDGVTVQMALADMTSKIAKQLEVQYPARIAPGASVMPLSEEIVETFVRFCLCCWAERGCCW